MAAHTLFKEWEIRRVLAKEVSKKLCEIPEPPRKLFVCGEMAPTHNKVLCVVGARKCTAYGMEMCRNIISGLRGLPLTIVSGMALGIDAVAHKAALEHNIHTIAVPGSGLDASVLYPRSHATLAKQILEQGGGLVSEFDLTWPAYPSNFPQRNRIMAGMCDATLVVEAELLSGTLITSKLALEYNRDILAVPGDVGSATSAGPHMLIRLGATLVRGPQDVAEILGFELGNLVQNAAPVLTDEEKVVVEAASTPISVDELLRTLPFSASHANALLMMLELRGVITQHAGVVRVKQ